MTRKEIIAALESIHAVCTGASVNGMEFYVNNFSMGDFNELLQDAAALLREPDKFAIKTTISNVDIPKGIDEEQFFSVLSQQYAALARLYGDDVLTYSPSNNRRIALETKEKVLQGLRLCRYDPDPGQECKQLVSCDICPYWTDEHGCREIDMLNDAIKVIEGTP